MKFLTKNHKKYQLLLVGLNILFCCFKIYWPASQCWNSCAARSIVTLVSPHFWLKRNSMLEWSLFLPSPELSCRCCCIRSREILTCHIRNPKEKKMKNLLMLVSHDGRKQSASFSFFCFCVHFCVFFLRFLRFIFRRKIAITRQVKTPSHICSSTQI